MAKQRKLHVLEYELAVKVNKDPSGGFVAKSLVWKDCYAQGDTIDEVTNEIASVAASLIELYKEEGLTIPLKEKKTSKAIFRIPVYTS
ncbi:hypothetical protein A2715_05455 [Candidatus Woesebacteria bacterium RIFCSPHIGHO2_01_FULL_39_32]|uniref:HicB-like antitoxin of toxin-antitoxin system domain-containing protein n=1 Tax=Candidatus Woesebacteria bacterium RIFCSPLOWO2_01_FULL_39_25 TaxID=1802521 RepID=A0A1F8BLQ2_9BACT|nr:MAG: hypothetical protein A2124_03900 [Candidatus Woesebacteria bacterium GWB1_37_5]OGM25466.1 MAG: hypothetical protein A2715_05455 [Candidatus Woesebacteria bacterium RIFCSPHIGHO2_01_FULL_39_32]OGM38569.1 MAG: hypothetical protein A3F01_04410 [Candidatus Woesebacteria bacterium RIFCSPHIGHO2_12_FULL_38_11]OGM64997.1 MAG: hypothetical protein A2893_05065 [Candidatus Woesebacteria bacterium RIFCSPLOWO2_01_FULL_39_25]